MEEEAVSPVIAVILMVAITVVLAATVFVLVSDIGGQGTAPPSVNLNIAPDNPNQAVIIQHVSGDTLVSGEYRVSVTLGRDSAALPDTCTGDLAVGQRISAFEVTDSADPSECVNRVIGTEGTDTLAAGTYHVVVIHIPSSSTISDRNVEIS